jgi:hypothetical protein
MNFRRTPPLAFGGDGGAKYNKKRDNSFYYPAIKLPG